MSAIAGALCFRDSRARVELIQEFQRTRGPDSQHAVDFATGTFGHNALHTTPAFDRVPEPHLEEQTGCVITADIRLTNRHQLLAQLSPRSEHIGDAQLALEAYLRWGNDFARWLKGDFALAIWDPRSNALLLCRDHFMQRPLYYALIDDGIIFASTVQGVQLASRQTPQTDGLKLAEFLSGFEYMDLTRTVFAGIKALPAATVLCWTQRSAPTTKRYWTPTQPPILKLASDRDYDEAFDEVLTLAVSSCLDTPHTTATMLSGGVDSSVVTAKAHALAPESVVAYAGTETTPSAESDTPFARSVATTLGVELREVSDTEIAQTYDLPGLLADPAALTDITMALWSSIAQRASADGAKVLLTGLGGDQNFTADPFAAANDLLRAGRVAEARYNLRRYEGQTIPLREATRFMIPQLTPARIRQVGRVKRIKRNLRTELHETGIDPNSSLGRELANVARRHRTSPTPAGRLRSAAGPSLQHAFAVYDRVGGRAGVEVRHPLADLRLVEFCLSLPSDQLHRRGWAKSIGRRFLAAHGEAAVASRPRAADGATPAMDAILQLYTSEPPSAARPIELEGVTARICAHNAQDNDHGVQSWLRNSLSLWAAIHGWPSADTAQMVGEDM